MATVTLHPILDTFVDQGIPTLPRNNAGNICVGDANSGTGGLPTTLGTSRGWLRFDLSSIPVGATITSAGFGIAGAWISNGNNYGLFSYSIQRCTDTAWTEGAITWNIAPDGNCVGSSVVVGTSDLNGFAIMLTNADVSSHIIAALPSRQINWRMKNDNEGDGTFLGFYDRETDPNWVSLVVNFTVGNNSSFFIGF